MQVIAQTADQRMNEVSATWQSVRGTAVHGVLCSIPWHLQNKGWSPGNLLINMTLLAFH